MSAFRSVYCQLQSTERKKVSERYYLADRTPETPSKDMVIIAKYDTESNEDRTVFIHEHGDTSLPALWD